MKWLNKKIRNALQDLMFAKSLGKEKEEVIPIRRINCYDEVEIIYVKKAQVLNAL